MQQNPIKSSCGTAYLAQHITSIHQNIGIRPNTALSFFPNLLLISGTGRNTRKTSYACKIIERMAGQIITAVKISRYFHPQKNQHLWYERSGEFQIFKELNPKGKKDSSRMLEAGATAVFYVQAEDPFVFEAFSTVYSTLSPVNPVLCESGGLSRFVKPSLHLLMMRRKPLQGDKRIDYFPDIIVRWHGSEYSFDPSGLEFDGKMWIRV